MKKKVIWIVAGVVVFVGAVYGSYWLGGSNTLNDFASWLNSNSDKSQALRIISGGHVVVWSADGLRIVSVDGGCPHSGC